MSKFPNPAAPQQVAHLLVLATKFLRAGLIHMTLPCATFIHCRRAAVDTTLSIHQTHFHPGSAFPTGDAELVAYFRGYEQLVDHWRRVLPPERFLDVDYEDPTRAPVPVMRRIIAACGLDWHDACLRPERNPRAVGTPASGRPGSRSIARPSGAGDATSPG